MPFDMTKPQSLADVLDRLTTRDDGSTRHRDRISAVRRVAEMVGRAPADMPCDAPDLRMYLDRIHPAQDRITAHTLANIKANLATALRAARAPGLHESGVAQRQAARSRGEGQAGEEDRGHSPVRLSAIALRLS